MSTFQIVITALFGFFIVLGFLAFSGLLPFLGGSDNSGLSGNVSVWGTVPQEFMNEPLRAMNAKNEKSYQVTYKELNESDFDRTLVEALARGDGPDLILLPHELILRHRDKIFAIPYESFPERRFKDTFVEEGELYLSSGGVLGFPFSLDPMVMYWNRDLFANAGLPQPPKKWDELFGLTTSLSTLDQVLNISQSTVSFGEYKNVRNAKGILSMLILQGGNPLVSSTENGSSYFSVLPENYGRTTAPAASALKFYTEFSNPVKPVYSWNRSLPESRDFFASGNLALYFGYASEYSRIRAQNPHLNVDVAVVPQANDVIRKTTFGNMTAAAILKRTTNMPAAFAAAVELSGSQFGTAFSLVSGLPPVRRDLLSQPQNDAVQSVFYSSALLARGWLDPDPSKTNDVFREMIENVISGRSKISEAVARAHGALGGLLR
jgi:ABC-type glycerol-3-phosphate transport system substrate-binding protein